MAWRTWWNSLHYIRSRPTRVPNTSMYIFKMNFRPKPCNPPEQALRVGQMRKAEKRNLQCEGITTLFLPITLYKTCPGAGNLWIHLLKFAGAVVISQIFLGNKGNSRVQTSKVCVSCCQPRLSCPLLTCLWYSARYCLDDLYTHCCFFTIKMPSATMEQLLFYPSTLCVKTDNFSFFPFHKSCGTDARWCSPQCRDSSESLWFFWASSRVCKCKNERWHLLGGAHLNETCHAFPLQLEIGRGLNFLDFSFLSVYILLSHNLLFLFLS